MNGEHSLTSYLKQFSGLLKRYLFLIYVFGKISLLSQMEYKINFISGVLVEIGYFLAKILYVIVIIKTGVTINGLKPENVVMFIGTYMVMTGIYMSFFPNFINISIYVKDGSLDMLITKPLSLQFMTTFKYIDFGMPIPNILGGLILIIWGWQKSEIDIDFINILGFSSFIFIGTLLTYSIFLLPNLLSFWTVSTKGIQRISNGLWDFNNMPMGIYNKLVQNIGIFFIPVFVITNYAPMFVLKKLNIFYLGWGITAPIIFFILTRLVWNAAMRRYGSAGG